jgi:hypothetical protein
LPELEGHTRIIVVVDWFSKMAHFIAITENVTPRDTVKSFLKEE